VFLRGCTSAVPFDGSVLAWGVFAFSFEAECSSLAVEREVEKCLEDGTRDRGGPAGVVGRAGDWVEDVWVKVEFARKRDWFEWFEK
jgi:hypothetical protein